MKTAIIIFSKDRTLQLKSLLVSIRTNGDISEENISIIYKNTISEISYEPLINEFKCNFVKQGDFLQDIKNIVSDSNRDYFNFMVDDLILRDKTSWREIESFMNSNQDIDSFCLRMGKNIQCGKEPEFEARGKYLVWETSNELGKHWNYAWDMASSLYRRNIVEKYLSRCRHNKETFPNPFEDHFYTCMPTTRPRSDWKVNLINSIRFCCQRKSIKIACFEKSRCFTQGVNLVADIEDDREQQFDPITLHKKMIDGWVIDFNCLKDVMNQQPNAGHQYFKLKKQKD